MKATSQADFLRSRERACLQSVVILSIKLPLMFSTEGFLFKQEVSPSMVTLVIAPA